jgi:hypothetical protein
MEVDQPRQEIIVVAENNIDGADMIRRRSNVGDHAVIAHRHDVVDQDLQPISSRCLEDGPTHNESHAPHCTLPRNGHLTPSRPTGHPEAVRFRIPDHVASSEPES